MPSAKYAFPNAVPGVYTVRASLAGFKTFESRGIIVGTQDFITLDLALGSGLNEDQWQLLVKRGRNYSREMAEAATDEEAIEIAVDAVHASRAEQRSGR